MSTLWHEHVGWCTLFYNPLGKALRYYETTTQNLNNIANIKRKATSTNGGKIIFSVAKEASKHYNI